MNKTNNKITKQIKRIFPVTVLLLLVFCMFISGMCSPVYGETTAIENEDAIKVTADKVAVLNTNTGEFVYVKNPDKKINPASCTKILTTIIALEECDLDEEITVSEDAVYGIDSTSSHIALTPGEKISVEDSLYGMLLSSGNDCAVAVSEHVAGSVDDFSKLMNEKADEIGCTNSHFTNPHGLYDKDHYTTVSDLAKIMDYCIQNDEFVKIDSSLKYNMAKTNKQAARELWNSHGMVETQYYPYAPVVGGKSGYTTESKFNLITYAEKDGAGLIVVVAGEESALQCCKDTQTLMEYFYKNYGIQKISFKECGIKSIKVDGKKVPVTSEEKLEVYLPNDYNKDDITYKATANKNTSLTVNKNEKVGKLTAYYQGEAVGSLDLYASEKVSSTSSQIIKVVLIITLIVLALALLILLLRFKNLKRKKQRQQRRKERQKNSQ